MTHMCLYPYDAGAIGGTAVVRSAKANQACYSCRKQKRKCDKALPSCALCTRMSRFCDYSETPPNPTVEDFEALRGRLAELEAKLHDTVRQVGTSSRSPPADEIYQSQDSQSYPADAVWKWGSSNTFDPAMFLDAKFFKDASITVTRPTVDIPQEVLQYIGDPEQLQHSLSSYFSDIHPWFPVVPRKRINITSSLWDGSPESTFLCLAMMLMAWQPIDGLMATRNYLYFAAKQFSAQLEHAGTVSLCYLQALVLIALYEYSHGIYPAAWMTVGQCVRYADFVGLPSYKESNSILGQCATWLEAEERRRAWWAVYIVDKVICLGSDKRPLCGEPSCNELLPVSDEAWDTGIASLAVQHTVSSPRTDFQTAFGRLCQAALLVSEALRHCQRAKLLKLQHEPPDHSEATGLIEAAYGLSTRLQAEVVAQPKRYLPIIPAHCIAYSVIFRIIETYLSDLPRGTAPIPGLQDTMWSNENLAVQLMAFESRKKTIVDMCDVSGNINACTPHKEDLAKMSPFVLNAIYSTGVTLSWLRGESSDSGTSINLEVIKKCLLGLSGRWGLASEYMTLLEQHGIHAMSSYPMPLAGVPLMVTGMPL
ncbi:fungal-specific transcription factor domain-containing protein [Xylariaceae sp. FL1651]|nr:fungal-specific transcription factor domain-containing protein [Xylariaceae sp. FL1651]